jgi:ferredoxin
MRLHNLVQSAGDIDIMPVDLVEFNSAGRLLVVGTEQQIAAVSSHLELTNLELITSPQRPTNIEGWLGKFYVDLDAKQFTVDLVLDLSEQPVVTSNVLPLGYFAPCDDAQALAEALQQLPELIGTFDKPRYFNYKPSICAHSRRQLAGCSQCIDACPADAITSNSDMVSVNPSLCQGCGSCTAVCPSGAMTYALPTLDVSVNRLRIMLQTYFELEDELISTSISAASSPQILIHDLNNGEIQIQSMAKQLPYHIIAFSIEEIGGLSMPFWLSALALGAGGITIWDAGSHSDHDWLELQQEIVKTNEMLVGIGYEQNVVNWCGDYDFRSLKTHLLSANQMPAIKRATFAGVDDKRRMISLALDHLHKQAPQAIEVLALANNAAFGELKIDKQACTLCHSCVSVCPVGAVLDGNDKPQLNFIEDLCVQCGLCETACPEDAITLIPQYLFNREQARRVRLLHEEPIFHCISCDKAFATKKMIDTMTEKLKNHAMFQGAALERLKMCEDCRVKAMFKAERSQF